MPKAGSKKVQKEKQKKERKDGEPGPAVADTTKADKLNEDMDAILDEIDSVLEENAEEFVKNYKQKGGE